MLFDACLYAKVFGKRIYSVHPIAIDVEILSEIIAPIGFELGLGAVGGFVVGFAL